MWASVSTFLGEIYFCLQPPGFPQARLERASIYIYIYIYIYMEFTCIYKYVHIYIHIDVLYTGHWSIFICLSGVRWSISRSMLPSPCPFWRPLSQSGPGRPPRAAGTTGLEALRTSRTGQRPTLLQELGSRASAVCGGEPSCTQLLPAPVLSLPPPARPAQNRHPVHRAPTQMPVPAGGESTGEGTQHNTTPSWSDRVFLNHTSADSH